VRSETLHRNGEATFVLVFEKSDEVVEELTAFAKDYRLAGSHFTAIGGLSQVTLGFFDPRLKAYKRIPLHEQVEVLSLAGNIAIDRKEPKVHAHVVVGRSDGTALGGHLLEGRVWPTLEVILEETPAYLRRSIDPETGLALLDLTRKGASAQPKS